MLKILTVYIVILLQLLMIHKLDSGNKNPVCTNIKPAEISVSDIQHEEEEQPATLYSKSDTIFDMTRKSGSSVNIVGF